MKTHWKRLVPLALLAATAAGASEEGLSTAFTWRQELREPPPPETLFRVAVPNELFDGCERFPNDLRILGADGRPWPYYLWTKPDRTQFESLAVRILNRGTAEGDGRHRVLELEVRSDAGRRRHNRIRIESDGEDFIRRVEILGGADRQEWLKLAEGWLIDHTEPTPVRNTEIRYPESDFPFLKLRIWPNAIHAEEVPTVSSIEVGKFAREDGDWETVELVEGPTPRKEKAHRQAQTHYFDTGAANRPLERLTLSIDDAEFARPVQIYGRNDLEQEWRLAHRGEIHRLGDKTHLDVPLDNFAYRHIKVQIFHYDDEPIELVGAAGHALARYLVAESRSETPAHLYYGSTSHQEPPRFDLKARRGFHEARDAVTIELSDRAPNEAFARTGAERLLPWVTGSVIAVVSLILIWVIAGMLKRGPTVAE
jgi:hypothetical protein